MRSVVCIAFLLIAVKVNADQLLLVQAIWRHGDRNPKYLCPNDPNKLDTWYQGLGHITADGLKQHFDLGQLIYDEYVTIMNFLSPSYKQDEIYMRSTDVNLTLQSAYANLLGMYFNRSAHKMDVNYPGIDGWPNGFVPVAAHTILRNLDHVGNTEPDCRRQDFLFELVKQTPEYQFYVQQQRETLQIAGYVCGTSLTIFDVWRLTDSYLVELYDNRPNKIMGASDFAMLRPIELKSQSFINGQGMNPLNTPYGTIDFEIEIPTVRSGGLIKDMIDHIDLKIFCMDPSNANKAECTWMSKLKYYAYSSHWATINALFTAFGVRDGILPSQLPDFASAFFIELWQTTYGDYSIRARYHDGPGERFRNVTHLFPGCSSSMCPYEEFRVHPMKFYPQDINKLCDDVPTDWKQKSKVNIETNKSKLPRKREALRSSRSSDNELLFVQAFWRHGDRTPNSICPNDPNNESTWPEGLGQLTALGMSQQRLLGSLIYEKYVNEMQFLSPIYTADEIYIRATDFNRTIISATSNFVGMYYNRTAAVLGRDYPGGEWPEKFVPVPVHTVEQSTDHLGDPNTYCPRQTALIDATVNSNEVRLYEKENQEFLANVSKICGKQIGLMDLVMPIDTWFIENLHNRTKIFSDEMYAKMRQLDSVAENVRHGLINENIQNGIDLRVELPKLRGGSQLWNIIDHMDQKIYCSEHPNAPYNECSWYQNLKYFAFSAHDSTLNGLLSALGIKEVITPDGLPEYAAAIFFELWKIDGQYKIKVNYRRNYTTLSWEDITGYISGCPSNDTCPYVDFKLRSIPFNPGNITELCANVPPFATTTLKPATTPSRAYNYQSHSYLLIVITAIYALIA
uniref:Acid phosphatase 11 n=1 Tax=Ascaris suum TaxID=6253 RepID=F1KVM4_ASCSU